MGYIIVQKNYDTAQSGGNEIQCSSWRLESHDSSGKAFILYCLTGSIIEAEKDRLVPMGLIPFDSILIIKPISDDREKYQSSENSANK